MQKCTPKPRALCAESGPTDVAVQLQKRALREVRADLGSLEALEVVVAMPLLLVASLLLVAMHLVTSRCQGRRLPGGPTGLFSIGTVALQYNWKVSRRRYPGAVCSGKACMFICQSFSTCGSILDQSFQVKTTPTRNSAAIEGVSAYQVGEERTNLEWVRVCCASEIRGYKAFEGIGFPMTHGKRVI